MSFKQFYNETKVVSKVKFETLKDVIKILGKVSDVSKKDVETFISSSNIHDEELLQRIKEYYKIGE